MLTSLRGCGGKPYVLGKRGIVRRWNLAHPLCVAPKLPVPYPLTPNLMPANNLANHPATSLADHIVAFGRVLRRAGVKVGSHQIMDATDRRRRRSAA